MSSMAALSLVFWKGKAETTTSDSSFPFLQTSDPSALLREAQKHYLMSQNCVGDSNVTKQETEKSCREPPQSHASPVPEGLYSSSVHPQPAHLSPHSAAEGGVPERGNEPSPRRLSELESRVEKGRQSTCPVGAER